MRGGRWDTEAVGQMADEQPNTTQPTQPVNAGNTSNTGAQTQKPTGETPTALTFDDVAKSLTDDQRRALDAHFETNTKGLKAALDKERDAAKTLEKQLKLIQDKAGKDTELAAELEKVRAELTATTREKQFIVEAPSKGVSNITAAYKLAVTDNLIDAKGNIDWDALQKSYPELFAKPQAPTAPNTNAADMGKQTPKQQLDDATSLAAKKFGIRIPAKN